MHEKYQSRIFTIVYYEDGGNMNDICVFCLKKHSRTLTSQSVFLSPAYHGDLLVFYSAVHSRSLILVILVMRGDFVSVCNFCSGVSRGSTRVFYAVHIVLLNPCDPRDTWRICFSLFFLSPAYHGDLHVFFMPCTSFS